MLRLASAPSYTTLAAGLAPADTGKVTAALDEQGIAYELRANGTVGRRREGDRRPRRASRSPSRACPSTQAATQKGFELFDEQKLGASDFQQQVTYQRALEGEIARTIEQVDGRRGRAGPARAARGLAVRRRGDAGHRGGHAHRPVRPALEPGAVRGIAQLVASSVKGLKTDNVTITDGAGQLLWPQGDGVGGVGGGAGSKLAAETRYERAAAGQPRRAADPDARPRQGARAGQGRPQRGQDDARARSIVDGEPVAAKETTETERLRGGGATAGGTAGHRRATSRPTPPARPAAGANSNYQREPAPVENVVPRTVDQDGRGARARSTSCRSRSSSTRPCPRPTSPRSRTPVQGAAGFDQERGDVFQAAQIPFAKAAAAPKAGPVPVAAARPAQVGRARPGDARLPVLHGAPPQAARGRGARRARPGCARSRSPSSLVAARGAARRRAPEQPTLILPPRAAGPRAPRRSSS